MNRNKNGLRKFCKLLNSSLNDVKKNSTKNIRIRPADGSVVLFMMIIIIKKKKKKASKSID